MSMVYVIGEGLWREQLRKMRSFDSIPPTFIRGTELVGVLSSAGDGRNDRRDYVLLEEDGRRAPVTQSA